MKTISPFVAGLMKSLVVDFWETNLDRKTLRHPKTGVVIQYYSETYDINFQRIEECVRVSNYTLSKEEGKELLKATEPIFFRAKLKEMQDITAQRKQQQEYFEKL